MIGKILILNILQHYLEAITSFDKVIEFQPDDVEAWYQRGLALSNLQQYSGAIASFDKATQLQPD